MDTFFNRRTDFPEIEHPERSVTGSSRGGNDQTCKRAEKAWNVSQTSRKASRRRNERRLCVGGSFVARMNQVERGERPPPPVEPPRRHAVQTSTSDTDFPRTPLAPSKMGSPNAILNQPGSNMTAYSWLNRWEKPGPRRSPDVRRPSEF